MSVLSGPGCLEDSESTANSESAWSGVKLKGARGKGVKVQTWKRRQKLGKREGMDRGGQVETIKLLETNVSV